MLGLQLQQGNVTRDAESERRRDDETLSLPLLQWVFCFYLPELELCVPMSLHTLFLAGHIFRAGLAP